MTPTQNYLKNLSALVEVANDLSIDWSCLLCESLEDEILLVYKLILKWQSGFKSKTVENKLRRLMDSIWDEVKPTFRDWIWQHGFDPSEKALDYWDEFLDSAIGSDTTLQSLRLQLNSLDEVFRESIEMRMEDEDSESEEYANLEERLVSGDIDYYDVDPYISEMILPQFKELMQYINDNAFKRLEEKEKSREIDLGELLFDFAKENSFDITPVGILDLFNTILHKHWKSYHQGVFNVIEHVRSTIESMEHITDMDIDKLIIEFDQMINLSHTSGEFLANITNFNRLRDDIDALG